MRIACWILKATDTHSEYVISLLSTAKIVAQARLIVTSYAHCLPRLIISLLRQLAAFSLFSLHAAFVMNQYVILTTAVERF